MKLRAVIAAVALTLALAVGAVGQGAKMPMPAAPVVAEDAGVCPSGTAGRVTFHGTAETAEAKYFIADVYYLENDPRPVAILINDNPFAPETNFTVYVDYNGDGIVDEKLRRDDPNLAAPCQYLDKAKEARGR